MQNINIKLKSILLTLSIIISIFGITHKVSASDLHLENLNIRNNIIYGTYTSYNGNPRVYIYLNESGVRQSDAGTNTFAYTYEEQVIADLTNSYFVDSPLWVIFDLVIGSGDTMKSDTLYADAITNALQVFRIERINGVFTVIENEPEPLPNLHPYTVNDIGVTAYTNANNPHILGGYTTGGGSFKTSNLSTTWGEYTNILNWEFLSYFHCIPCSFPNTDDYPTLFFFHENPINKTIEPYYHVSIAVQKNKYDLMRTNLYFKPDNTLTQIIKNDKTGITILDRTSSLPDFNFNTDYVVLGRSNLGVWYGSDYYLDTPNPPLTSDVYTVMSNISPISGYGTPYYATYPYKVDGSNITSSSFYQAVSINGSCVDGIKNQDETDIDYGGVCGFGSLYDSGINVKVKTTDNVVHSTPFNYLGNEKNDLSLEVRGNNPLNQYDTYVIKVFENEDNLIKTYNGVINFSCTNNCQFFELPLSIFDIVWKDKESYRFELFFTGTLAPSSVTLNFNLGFNEEFVTTSSCSILDISCHFRNFIIVSTRAFQDFMSWLFVINDTSLEPIFAMFDDVQNKAPMIYLLYVSNFWSGLSAGTSTSAPTLSIPIGSQSITLFSSSLLSDNPVAPLVKNSLTIVLWILLVFALYSRALTIFDSSNQGIPRK